jgi:hypothetical protein
LNFFLYLKKKNKKCEYNFIKNTLNNKLRQE